MPQLSVLPGLIACRRNRGPSQGLAPCAVTRSRGRSLVRKFNRLTGGRFFEFYLTQCKSRHQKPEAQLSPRSEVGQPEQLLQVPGLQNFSIINHFSIPGQLCGFSNQLGLFGNNGTGAYQIRVEHLLLASAADI